MSDTLLLQGYSQQLQCNVFYEYTFQHLNPQIIDTIITTSNICFWEDIIQLNEQGIFNSYTWEPNLSSSSQIEITNPTVKDTIKLTVTDSYGCEYYRQFQFNYFPLPDSTLKTSAFCYTSQQIQVYAPKGFPPYQWTVNNQFFDDTAHTISVQQPIVGQFIESKFVDTLGCVSYANLVLDGELIPQVADSYVSSFPNTFSPYTIDGLNDQFIFPIENFDAYNLTIFNRWGNVVHNKSGTYGKIAWNINTGAERLPAGTYFYTLEVKGCNLDLLSNFKGSIYFTED